MDTCKKGEVFMEPEKNIREHIKESFLREAEKNEYQRISVTSVCKEAKINRSTFYFYFESIEMLLNEMEYDFMSQIPFLDCMTSESVIFG